MEAQSLKAESQKDKRRPSMDAMQLADAIKRILMNDEGELAERLDGIMGFPLMATDNAMFFALIGVEVSQLRAELHLEPLPVKEHPDPDRNPGDVLAELAGTQMALQNITYWQAAEYVLKTNPELAREYAEYHRRPTCPACHHAGGLHEPDCTEGN